MPHVLGSGIKSVGIRHNAGVGLIFWASESYSASSFPSGHLSIFIISEEWCEYWYNIDKRRSWSSGGVAMIAVYLSLRLFLISCCFCLLKSVICIVIIQVVLTIMPILRPIINNHVCIQTFRIGSIILSISLFTLAYIRLFYKWRGTCTVYYRH